jgi:hypothetical protein
MTAALAECAVFARAVTRHSGASVIQPLVIPTVAATIAAAVGWVTASSLSATLPNACLAGAAAAGLYLALVLLIRRSLVADASGILNRMIRASFAAG